MIVDSGGPYSYGSAWSKNYFQASRAHNVIIADDQDFVDLGSTLLGSGDSEYASFVTASHQNIPDATHARTLIHLKDEFVIVFDTISANRQHTYDLIFHLDPDAAVTLNRFCVRLNCRNRLVDSDFIRYRDFDVHCFRRVGRQATRVGN
ncbi:hypothetical protein E4Q23_07650 [Candidatus Accumulibacter phosphatis]|uniref:Heparinase II/III-like C-terminal domain-containing protein n=1 Tax=Candidatus Accumulibacter phosphatis TaxID=327160 RepID=A0ABX1TWK1_9PROT|nr:hypothetical protein [Candidatus Accumulibacter phosphatis]